MHGSPAGLSEVLVRPRSFDALNEHLGADARAQLRLAREDAADALAGRTVWWVNSTPQGGGVAEMLRTLLPYWKGSGVDARWLVLEAPSSYFRLTKRLHNLLHGVAEREPGIRDHALYEWVAHRAGAVARGLVSPRDVVILEDPQTAGLVPELRVSGAAVIWRCHVGCDGEPEPTEPAWRFLLPFLEGTDAFAFTRREHIPAALDGRRTLVLRPAIDPLSAKNQELPPSIAESILSRCGLARAMREPRPTRVALLDGRLVDVHRRCSVLREGSAARPHADRLVVALGRWDRLKDPVGIVRGFAGQVRHPNARLIVAGPASRSIVDDPGSRAVLQETHAAWRQLPEVKRRRIDIATLPMVDLDENALIVNALQREAAVIVKKSLREGFGLGVTEGLWKARPVVATKVGGHRDQIQHRRTGLMIDDPHDLAAFGAAIDELLEETERAAAMARAGRELVRRRFLADQHFVGWIAALRAVLRRAATV